MTDDQELAVVAFERALGLDPAGNESAQEETERQRLERRLSVLDEPTEPVRPGADLFARISMKLGSDSPVAGFHFVRRDEGEWKPLSPGIDTRTLWRSAASGRWVFLLRLQPGAVLREHVHGGDEECLLLEGDMQVNGLELAPGDFQVALAGSRHPHVTTRGGCTCLISMAA